MITMTAPRCTYSRNSSARTSSTSCRRICVTSVNPPELYAVTHHWWTLVYTIAKSWWPELLKTWFVEEFTTVIFVLSITISGSISFCYGSEEDADDDFKTGPSFLRKADAPVPRLSPATVRNMYASFCIKCLPKYTFSWCFTVSLVQFPFLL